MHFEGRLWQFTAGVRGRIAGSAAIGLLAAALGVARLGLIQVFLISVIVYYMPERTTKIILGIIRIGRLCRRES